MLCDADDEVRAAPSEPLGRSATVAPPGRARASGLLPTASPHGAALRGRDTELAQLRRLLEDVAGGHGRALVIVGERGIGKSTLLRELASITSPTVTLLRTTGAEDEAGLAFAAVQQLCMPVLDGAARLPEPQQDALLTAVGVRSGSSPDPFLVGLAVLGILTALAADGAVLCLIDDAHWIDDESAGVLRFVSRRMGSSGVGLVMATRADDGDGLLDHAETLELGGLPTADARALLRRLLPGPIDSRVEGQILAEARGNPRVLVEFGRSVAPAELAGGFGVPRLRAAPSRGVAALTTRFAALHPEEQRLVTIAVADPTGDPALLRAAGRRVGIAPEVLERDGLADLVEVGDRVVFPDPLVRSALYGAVTPEARRGAHEALADAILDPADACWRVWHRSFAAAGRHSKLASELESAAATAQARGGLAAAAVFWERAAAFSEDAAERGRRLLVAAELKHRAGDSEGALRLLADPEPVLGEGELRERAELLRARAVYALNRDDEVPAPLRHAAADLEALDRRLARDTHVEALSSVLTLPPVLPDRHPSGAAEVSSRPPAVESLTEALTVLDDEGFVVGAPAMMAALARYRSEVLSDDDALRWDWLACRAAAYVWDFPDVDALSARMVRLPRELGSLRALPLGLSYRMIPLVLRGEIAAAASLGVELRAIGPARATLPLAAGELHVQAWRGREREAALFIDRLEAESALSGETMGVAAACMARAVLHNGLGLHDVAFEAALRGAEMSEGMLFQNLSLPELVEAAVRCRRHDVAEEAMRSLAERTAAAGGAWARGVELRSRALMADGDDVESLYRESILLLGASDVRTEYARSLLLFGEWLRRRRRRAEARAHLRGAHAMFVEMGMEGFATRAERELAAVGDSLRNAPSGRVVDLTARELEIARLAVEGLSNPEIGIRLYLSARTVQYHLRKVFMKLQISSRVQLAGVLEGVEAGSATPTLAASAS